VTEQDYGIFLPRPDPADVAALDAECFRDGLLRVPPASFYARFDQNALSAWCVVRGLYLLPTLELVSLLRTMIGEDRAIEVAAGNGALGRALGIPVTDSRQHEQPDVARFYAQVGQAVTPYAPDVERLTAIEAVDKYRPQVVLGSWITHRFDERYPQRGGNPDGVDCVELYGRAFVQTIILIGHERVNRYQPLLQQPHTTLRPPGMLFARPLDAGLNVIWVWDKATDANR
jgi:hypothetical protein